MGFYGMPVRILSKNERRVSTPTFHVQTPMVCESFIEGHSKVKPINYALQAANPYPVYGELF